MARKPDAEETMQMLVPQIVEFAKSNKIVLDYTDESIQGLEKLLGMIHKEYKKTKSEEGMIGLALMCGGYIGEVIRKKGKGGTWKRDHPQFGEDSFPFEWQGSTLFLMGWCLKRIFDGPGDNVWSKYQALILAEDATKTPRKK